MDDIDIFLAVGDNLERSIGDDGDPMPNDPADPRLGARVMVIGGGVWATCGMEEEDERRASCGDMGGLGRSMVSRCRGD